MPKIALIQMLVVPGQPEQNLARAVSRIEEAARSRAEAVILPEALDCGWTDPSARSFAGAIPGGETFHEADAPFEPEPSPQPSPVRRERESEAPGGSWAQCAKIGWGVSHPNPLPSDGSGGRKRSIVHEPNGPRFSEGEAFHQLSLAAAHHKVFVTAGITERAGEKIFNTAVLISPKGKLLLHHRKINELELGHDLYSLGDRLQVCDTAIGRIGLMICADAFAHQQVIARTLCYMGAEMIFSPCAWAVPADHDNATEPYGQLWLDNYCPVASSFKTWIFGVSNVGPITSGPWAGRKCIGCSLAIGPDGRVIERGPYGEIAEAVVYADASSVPRTVRGTGWEHVLK